MSVQFFAASYGAITLLKKKMPTTTFLYFPLFLSLKEVINMGMGSCMCAHCHGIYKVVFGALLLLNAFVWPKWMGIDGWVQWLAVLMVVGGLVKYFVPNKCTNCAAMMGTGKKK